MKNKKIATALLVIIMLLAAAPYFVGNMARDIIEKQAGKISQMPGYALKISDYDQGWFASRATIAFGFDPHTLNILAKSSPKDQEIDQQTLKVLKQGLVFDVTISHGPVTFYKGMHFALLTLSGTLRDIDHEAYKTFKEKAGIDGLLDLFAVVSYDGGLEITARSPAFKADYSDISNQKMIIDSAGMDFQATINADQDHYTADADIKRLGIIMKDGTVTLNQMAVRADGDRINDYLWTGNGATSFGEFTIREPKNTLLSLKKFNSDYALARESGDKALTMHVTSSAEGVDTAELTIKDFQIDLDINHLDIAAITDYVKSIQESYQLPDGTEPTAEQTAANIRKIATRTGEKLIKSSPELVINSLKTMLNGGSFEGNGAMSINGQGLANIQQLSDPVALNKRLISRVSLEFDRKMARAIMLLELKKRRLPKKQLDQAVTAQTTAFLQNFVAQGYLKQQGEKYSILFDMKNGQRLINGKPLPIPGM